MEMELRYGTGILRPDLPETPGFQGILRPDDPPALPEPRQAVANALRNPVRSPPLRELARGRRTACVVISDITRPVPNKLILPPILDTLLATGMAREDILILIATGSHRPNRGKELVALVGEEIARGFPTVNHVGSRQTDMVWVGDIAGDVPAYVNRAYVDADLKILTGFIEPHLWAGYSGGRKSILPGISGLETLKYMHGPEMIAHPRTVYGALEGNPFHEAGLAVMAAAGADFIVNVTLDSEKQTTGVFAGHPVEAHLAGCRFLAPFCVKTLTAPLDFVVTTNAGAPLDCSLYQTVKGIASVAGVVREGGTILSASACFEGVGSEQFEEILDQVDDPRRFLDRLMAGDLYIPEQWCAQELYQLLLQHPVWVYTEGIPPETLTRYHLRPVSSVEQAVSELLAEHGPEAQWALVPDGPLLILQPG